MASDYFLEKSLKSLEVKSKSSLSQIKHKHRIFMTKHPTGVVKRKDIIEIFSKILPHKYSENLCDLVLKLFGNKNRNEIDFEKAVMADMTMRKWTIDEKLIWFFNILDRFEFRCSSNISSVTIILENVLVLFRWQKSLRFSQRFTSSRTKKPRKP